MLDVICDECGSEILAITGYEKGKRRRIKVGDFCPDCLIFVRYTENFYKMRDGILEENKERRKHKPKFLKKERRAGQKCWENGKVNRNKWTIRKMPKKKLMLLQINIIEEDNQENLRTNPLIFQKVKTINFLI